MAKQGVELISGVEPSTKTPIVLMVMPTGENFLFQASDMRKLAVNIIEAAEAAETDAMLLKFLGRGVQLDAQEADSILQAFKQFRRELDPRQAE